MNHAQYRFFFVEDVMEILGISQSKAYQIMRRINKELEAEGYETIAGRVPQKRFCEKFYCGEAPTSYKPTLVGTPQRRKPDAKNHRTAAAQA